MEPKKAAEQSFEARPTAGLRGASWSVDRIPAGMHSTAFGVHTSDGAQVSGFLHARGGERTVVMVMHPRELLATHYMAPYIVDGGYACWTQGPRTVGNDLRLEHEIALLDVAAGVVHLKKLGYEKVVLLGNSGGAGLFAFYNQQAKLAPDDRIRSTPGQRPTRLDAADMPVADGFIFLAPHPGQGKLLLNCIDPSVTEERDSFSVNAELDPFSERNGFRPRPSSSQYAPEFVKRYRVAQRERVARIDESAKELIAARATAKLRSKSTGARKDIMAAAFNTIFQVWRTDADLRCFDLTLEPSDRRWGTVWGGDPVASNLGAVGFGRVCTPESWLSTWSGLTSNASFERCGESISQPTLVIYYTGDNTVFPSDVDGIFQSIRAEDKERLDVAGNHHGHALKPDAVWPQDIAGEHATSWLHARFPGTR